MSLLRQFLVSLALLALGIVGLASVSEEVRRMIALLGVDPTPLAVASTRSPAPERARAPGPTRVVMADVKSAQAATKLRTIGTGRALRSVMLYPQSSGIVARLDIVAGERVEAGHVIAALDQQLEAIAQARARVALAAARADFERLTTLANRQAVTQVSLDAARRILERVELDLRDADLALERRLVRAPFAGILGITEVEVGDYVETDTVIGIIDDRSEIAIDLYAPERFASLVRLGQPVSATTISRPGEVFAGEIVAIDNQVDAASRTLRLRAAIDNPHDVLRPGLSFAVELEFPGETHASVPALAVQWRAEGPYVWRVREGKAQPVPVEVVERHQETVLLRGELVPGDRVVTEGVLKLRPGAEVADAPLPAKSDS
ncbi:MAG TPA: efflux RND transporter periplasmic adaptor subunit [Paracoccaceae bacterium]|nr:efflux RND transporter periplasmic adaptor subunit [Paracoccaceae bacterium]